MALNKLFVYGTLKQRHSNHDRFMSHAKYLGDGATQQSIWALYDLGFFPALTYGQMKVEGEVYEVTDYELGQIDMLEGTDSGLYQRHMIVVEVVGVEHHCHTYLMMDHGFATGQYGSPMERWSWPSYEGGE